MHCNSVPGGGSGENDVTHGKRLFEIGNFPSAMTAVVRRKSGLQYASRVAPDTRTTHSCRPARPAAARLPERNSVATASVASAAALLAAAPVARVPPPRNRSANCTCPAHRPDPASPSRRSTLRRTSRPDGKDRFRVTGIAGATSSQARGFPRSGKWSAGNVRARRGGTTLVSTTGHPLQLCFLAVPARQHPESSFCRPVRQAAARRRGADLFVGTSSTTAQWPLPTRESPTSSQPARPARAPRAAARLPDQPHRPLPQSAYRKPAHRFPKLGAGIFRGHDRRVGASPEGRV